MVRRGGCCTALHLKEENARFILLAVVMILYMLFGATVFYYLERDGEEIARQKYWNMYEMFMKKYGQFLNTTDLQLLLHEHSKATASGLIGKRARWDFPGALYFVGTVVSTIGFGMSTPKTIYGRAMVIIYGFLGCSGAILFFNLFLERIITLLAFVMRFYHERELRRNERKNRNEGRRESIGSIDDRLDENWKPSVYWVMLCLFCATIVVAASASGLYSAMEKWNYFDCIYFCFVTFSTIGFGDMVASQQPAYDNVEAYGLINFIIIVFGCCCTYSLFNVTSIVIKQFLNWLIKKLDFKCNCFRKKKSPVMTQVTRSRRNAITPHHLKNYSNNHHPTVTMKTSITDVPSDADSTYDSDAEKRNSDEMICMKDLLRTNKVSLALLQKELYESAQMGRNYRNPNILLPNKVDDFKTGAVGPLAIVTKTLGDDE